MVDLEALGFAVVPTSTGCPSYHPATLLKLYIYGYLNRVQSSRLLDGAAICATCAQFIVICRNIGLFRRPLAAIDGSKFKGVNARDRNVTHGKVRTRQDKLNETIARYLTALDAADRQESMDVPSGSQRLRDKLVLLKAQMQKLEAAVVASPDKQVSLTDPDTRLIVIGDCLTGVGTPIAARPAKS